MKVKLIDLFNNKFDFSKVETFLEQHNAERIANRFLELFEELMKNRNGR